MVRSSKTRARQSRTRRSNPAKWNASRPSIKGADIVQSGSTPTTMDEYISTFPPKVRSILKKIRATVRKAAPQSSEKISYRMPAFFDGGVLIYFAAFNHHIGLFPPVEGD